MTAPLPTTPALDRAVADLVIQVAPWLRIGDVITAIRRMQDGATLDALGYSTAAPTRTVAYNAPVVFDLDRFRASRAMVCQDDDEPEAA